MLQTGNLLACSCVGLSDSLGADDGVGEGIAESVGSRDKLGPSEGWLVTVGSADTLGTEDGRVLTVG